MISDLKVSYEEKEAAKSLKVSELPDSDLDRIKYMQDTDGIDLSEDLRVKMI